MSQNVHKNKTNGIINRLTGLTSKLIRIQNPEAICDLIWVRIIRSNAFIATKVSAVGLKLFSEVVLATSSTGKIIGSLKHCGTTHQLREMLNISVNTEAS